MQKTLGGDRLGSGSKMKVDLHNFGRSTHNMSYLWRSTMSAGTLVPFMKQLALPGDTFDIDLDADGKTHPTVGPLFGSYKMQLDVFQAPIRLYNAQLHNNKLGIGLAMASVALPQITLFADPTNEITLSADIDNSQINPSCILSYLGIRGIGEVDPLEPEPVPRNFNAIPLLAYWEIYKNYYANKQEEIGYVIHRPTDPIIVNNVTAFDIGGNPLAQSPAQTNIIINTYGTAVEIAFSGGNQPLGDLIVNTDKGMFYVTDIIQGLVSTGTLHTFNWNFGVTGTVTVINWLYRNPQDDIIGSPIPTEFPLSNIDEMREAILLAGSTPFIVNTIPLAPYDLLLNTTTGIKYNNTQEGLGLKTYQSDLFNNWLSTEWIDGVGGINDITAIDTTGGSFNIDTFILSKKVYDMLNRIAVSGGSYDDWLDAVYTEERYRKCESPIYCGGLMRELVFQEVVSNSESANDNSSQPLGTLAGKGVMAHGKKGGKITIKVDEPSYIIGIISLTPRIDYSQGNEWDTHLQTMDDLHKPSLDEIGFQELLIEQMAWWSTFRGLGNNGWTQRSAGKQPAWINYMTNVNQTRGNFAIQSNEMFMTLNRRYEYGVGGIADLTTYIDPTKFNQIFAQTSIDAQNFWVQISLDMIVRRKISAKLMPNL